MVHHSLIQLRQAEVSSKATKAQFFIHSIRLSPAENGYVTALVNGMQVVVQVALITPLTEHFKCVA